MSRCKLTPLFIFLMVMTAWPTATSTVVVADASLGVSAPGVKTQVPHPDSVQGLKQELKDMLIAARSPRSDRLRAMIVDLEIPDARAWYLANFGTSGLKTADCYEKNLTTSEERLEKQMIEFAHEDGYFSVKRQDGKKVFPGLVTDRKVFLVAWEKTSVYGEDTSETPFGYFLFVDGKFRWDSTITWVTVD